MNIVGSGRQQRASVSRGSAESRVSSWNGAAGAGIGQIGETIGTGTGWTIARFVERVDSATQSEHRGWSAFVAAQRPPTGHPQG